MSNPVAMAIAAHPDDIEFMMAGTLLLLKQAGMDIHMWNLAKGQGGTAVYSYDEITRLRWEEALDSARIAGATLHPPITEDLDILYVPDQLARVAAVIRLVQPTILLIPSPQDYMEDHANTARLAVTGAFVRDILNFRTEPAVPQWGGECVLYHALPYGLRDGLRRRIHAGQYVDIAGVIATKQRMLEQHRSQKDWLDTSQGTGAYAAVMVDMAREVGAMSGHFALAEGWRRHSHLGFSSRDADPLHDMLGDACWVDPDYEAGLE